MFFWFCDKMIVDFLFFVKIKFLVLDKGDRGIGCLFIWCDVYIVL